jgi:hypothetical protein
VDVIDLISSDNEGESESESEAISPAPPTFKRGRIEPIANAPSKRNRDVEVIDLTSLDGGSSSSKTKKKRNHLFQFTRKLTK